MSPTNFAKRRRFDEHYGWTLCLFGSQAHPGDFHHTGFTELSLKVYLAAAGFELEAFHVNDCWLFDVRRVKAMDWRESLRTGGNGRGVPASRLRVGM